MKTPEGRQTVANNDTNVASMASKRRGKDKIYKARMSVVDKLFGADSPEAGLFAHLEVHSEDEITNVDGRAFRHRIRVAWRGAKLDQFISLIDKCIEGREIVPKAKKQAKELTNRGPYSSTLDEDQYLPKKFQKSLVSELWFSKLPGVTAHYLELNDTDIVDINQAIHDLTNLLALDPSQNPVTHWFIGEVWVQLYYRFPKLQQSYLKSNSQRIIKVISKVNNCADQMDYFGPDQIRCCCVPLGCHNERFEFDDQIHSGRLFHRTNFKRHLQKSKNNKNTPMRSTNTNEVLSDQLSSVNTLGSHGQQIQSSEKRKERSENEDKSSGDEDVHRPKKIQRVENSNITLPAITLMTFPTESYKIPQKFLQHKMCLESMMNVAYDHIFHKKSNCSCRKSLTFEKTRVKKWMTSANPKSIPFWKEIPATIQDLLKRFHLKITPIETIIRKQLDKAELEGIYPEDQPSALPHLVPDTDALTECPEDESSEPSSDSRMSYPQAAKSQTSTTTILSHPTTTNRSDASDSSSSTILGAHGPALTPHELKLIHISIEQAITPSWLPVVPSLFGTTAHGSVKAVQWLVLYTVYMVFSLIPYHANAEPNSDSQKIHTAILLATQIINISVSRVMSEEDIQSLGLLLKTYRQHLQTVWPNIKSKPNLHFAQHLPDQCRRLGPPPYTAAWVGERLIGTLVQTPKNFCAANLSITSRNSATRWKEFSPPGDVLHAVKELLQSNSSVSSASIDLMSTSLWRHSGKSYSISSRHLGNSYIEYHINGKHGFGSIEHIVRLGIWDMASSGFGEI
ncbi:uncharacterized protein MELLADRAFT_104527 [Melampsora larici-populina 98AG31]|uniref:Uncharacterized protein n=1 Tax=Melampsora larici-populina (strain 98AG31 / pathotype 3-4-7) TaxID=747676 RepID=F4REZ8_MELLP|nr:uncharacterized protein MELLADRAFT_104527 [Melampsora larici-populina 98AG31]EGG09196.1 hypothetical protein MELLADRAFT_104527 [Melampsora larici-populina 98AG31]